MYSHLGSSLEIWTLESNIEIGEHTKSGKNNKKCRRLQF